MPGFSYNDLIEVYTEHFNPNYPVLDLLKRLKGKGRKVYILSNLADFHRIAAENRIPDIFKLFDKNSSLTKWVIISPSRRYTGERDRSAVRQIKSYFSTTLGKR